MQKRSSERSYPSRQRVACGKATDERLLPANVRDSSASGIGLLVSGEVNASLGDPIRVLFRDEQYPKHARIVRLCTERTASGEADTLLGCRWVTSADRRRSRRRAVRARRNKSTHA